MRTNRKAVVILAFCIGASTTGCRSRIETYSQNCISGGELRPPLQSLFAHISEEHYVTVNGKTFNDVRGTAPYYLDIPELKSVLVVTGNEDDGNVKFRIVSRETGHELVISGGQTHFGAHIGAPEPYRDSVLKASSEKLILMSQGPKAKMIIVLNLLSKNVESVQRQAN